MTNYGENMADSLAVHCSHYSIIKGNSGMKTIHNLDLKMLPHVKAGWPDKFVKITQNVAQPDF
jgi:hypothetical protein